jgi:pyridinium-3,5-bisthiocarboxylic acid mononucleotide nickel chelatase
MALRIAYFDCYSGASGDMLLGALLDAGLDLHDLESDLAGLGLSGYELTLTRQVRRGIAGSKLDVTDHGEQRPAHNLHAIEHILEASTLSASVASGSLRVFQRLAEAEAAVHGTTVEEIHFHEVGAVDALVDIVGFCCAIERLGVGALYVSPLPLGSGMVRTEHGLLPVPAPATLALLAAAQAPIVPSHVRAELVTPTGAALLSSLATFGQRPMAVQRVGYGFGTKEFAWPNAVRVWIGEEMETVGVLPQQGPSRDHDPVPDHVHEDAPGHSHAHGHEHEHHSPQGHGDAQTK